MASGASLYRRSSRAFSVAALLILCALTLWPVHPASAERSTFRTYGGDQGLSSVGGSCMIQDRAGVMLVCTENGVFAYDGNGFVGLGPKQGLREGGIVYNLALTSTGRVVVGYADEVFVSDRASDAARPPTSLSFRKAVHPDISFYDKKTHRLASWRADIVLLAGEIAVRLVTSGSGPPHVEPMNYGRDERQRLVGASAVFSIDGTLWETFPDGRLCAADPGAVKCYGPADGLVEGPWMDVVAGGDGKVLARSASAVGTYDPVSARWSVVDLPDQGGRYSSYVTHLGLFHTPDGVWVTQADHGLAMLRPEGWRLLGVQDGAPDGDVMSALSDESGQLWFQVLGRGLVRWVGYGHWETLQKAGGLSDGISWQSARPPGGPLFVSTDTGVDEVVRQAGVLRVGRVFPGPSYALAVGPRGELWSSYGLKGARVINPADGSISRIELPPVDVIVPDRAGFVWVGTEAGLFRIEDIAGAPRRAVLVGSPDTPVLDIDCDGSGGVFYLAAGRLRHRHGDGTDAPVSGSWPVDGFDPAALAVDHDGAIWIGGAGLFRFVLSGDRIVGYRAIPTSDTRTNSIVAVIVDHRGWVWAGTSMGVSAFDGQRWVSVDADDGLVSNDVDEGGIREDPDGSIWIATTEGFSHLLSPSRLFNDQPFDVVVSQARLGAVPVEGQQIPFTRQALSIQFGTRNHATERSLSFRYRLAGVDADWVQSTTGVVRYPFVPPGRHMLTVVGTDEMTHRSSEPATLLVDVAFPWWRRWWSETLWVLTTIALVYGAMALRLRAVIARQAELKRHVAAATVEIRVAHEEMRLAQASLQYQAAHDSLTGLLNRREIESRLAAKLSDWQESDEMIVALFDIDHFKSVNDRHGHLGGDYVLRSIGRLVARALRAEEYAGRYGGEEILLVLKDTDGAAAKRVLDLHLAIRHDTFDAAGSSIHVTCSVGLAWAIRGDDWESLIGRADEALYAAKEGGRDRIVESSRVNPGFPNMAPSRPGLQASGRRAPSAR